MKNIKNSNILITGGAGFIGSTLADRLVDQGAKVTIFDAMISPYGGNEFNISKIKKQIKFIQKDIRNDEELKKAIDGKDFIFHLAGQTGRSISMNDPVLDTNINLIGTMNVLNAIRLQKKKPKLVFASSRGVIGKPDYLPVDENHVPNPRDIYGINKLAAEKSVLLFGKEYEFGATALRLNNVYGPRCQIKSNHYGTINLFVSYSLRRMEMPIYGSGLQTRDYVYVDDVVDAFMLSMDKKANGEYYFVGTGVATSLLDVVKIIKKYIPESKHKKVEFPKDLKSVDFKEFYSTSKKIEEDLKWKAKIDIDSGIKMTIDFYKESLAHYL